MQTQDVKPTVAGRDSCASSDSCEHSGTVGDHAVSEAYADILSQAITGELVGMQNFASMAQITDDIQEKIAAIDHANSERGHAVAFLKAAERLNLPVNVDLEAPYWGRLRRGFQTFVAERDVVACNLAQEVMMESMAVSMYREVGKAINGSLGELFTEIATDEEQHLAHSLDEFQAMMLRDPLGFERKVYRVHKEIMTIIGEMTAKDDPSGHCGICNGNCVKTKLGAVNLEMSRLRGGSMQLYLSMLDHIGLPGDKTLQWMCELPA
jgi:fatty aldehyde decarbonylase